MFEQTNFFAFFHVEVVGRSLLPKLRHLHLHLNHVVFVGGDEVGLVLLDYGRVERVQLVDHVVHFFVGLHDLFLVGLIILPQGILHIVERLLGQV